MNKVNRGAIRQLLETEDNTTLSIYMPTHRFPTSDHVSEDKIRFKNLIKTGKEALERAGVSDETVRHMTGQLESAVYENDDFWLTVTEGTAVFCSPAGIKTFHVPLECDEYVGVGDRYDIAPLLAVASYDQPYYLLALATKHPVLLKGDMYGLERVAIDLPTSPEEALRIDELYSNSQTNRSGGHGAGVKAHGQGDTRQAGREERLKFFRLIDEKLQSAKNVDKTMPILLAGTDDEVSSYREVSRHNRLLEEALTGNYTDTPSHEIHERAWPLITEAFDCERQTREVDLLGNLLGTGKASTDIGSIAAAAREGRVATFFLGMLTTTRDTVSDSNKAVMKLVLPDSYRDKSIGACARAVFDQGGKIIGVLRSALPSGASEAAVYRY